MNAYDIPVDTGCCDGEELHEIVRSVPIFAGIDEPSIEHLLRNSQVRHLTRGETLVENGAPASNAFIVIDGELEVARCSGTLPIPIGVRVRGDLVGEMALLTDAPRNATLRARTDTRLLIIHGDRLRAWLDQHPCVTRRILSTAVSRLKNAEMHLVRHQNLAALGTLAAGLAHELNNPASALLRGASQLADAVLAWEQTSWRLAGGTGSGPFSSMRGSLSRTPAPPASLDPLARGDLEQQLQSWLRGQNVENAWELAPALVEHGWDLTSLRDALADVPPEHVPDSLHWLAQGGQVLDLLRELHISAKVISDLVAAVKSYSRLDEAPVQQVNLHAGIEQAITILRYKLRGVQVIREYADNLPEVTAYATELNQLWTNLIDNAIDAMDGTGELVITTSLDDDYVEVDVRDSGAGIPPEALSRLFEPFYTTKPPGRGTGLGLAIGHSTVQRHGGSIEVESAPGRTCFRVRLPVTHAGGLEANM